MNRIATTILVMTALGALTQGCGDPNGVRAQGSVALVVHQTGQADGTAGFSLPADTYVDAPPGVGRGFYGTCARANGRWTVDVSRADAIPGGLRRVALSAAEGSAAGAVSAKFDLGTTEFSGAAECTATAAAYGDKGVRFTASCTNVHGPGDLRTLDATVSLTLENCSVQ